jgi:hypothetical protein
MTLAPWDYLFVPFRSEKFPDVFWQVVVASFIWLAVLVVMYNVRTRRLHAHAPYLDQYEWLLWTGLITFTLVIVYAIFAFDFFFVPITLAIGLGTLVWIRFVRFPPVLATYETRLAKQRYFSRSKFAHPESTIRPKAARAKGSRPIRVSPSKRRRRR